MPPVAVIVLPVTLLIIALLMCLVIIACPDVYSVQIFVDNNDLSL